MVKERLSRTESQNYWIPKIEKNMMRDQQVNEALQELGWHVIRFWGDDIKKEVPPYMNDFEDAAEPFWINTSWGRIGNYAFIKRALGYE